MQHTDWSMAYSLIAFVLVQVSKVMQTAPMMEAVTAISAVVFCLTSIVKLIDLIMEKYRKWKRKATPED